METNKTKDGDGLAGVIVDKLRQSLKRDFSGNAIGDSASRPARHHGNRTSTDEMSTAPHKSKRKPSVKYNGLSELELSQRHLPDHLVLNLDILIVGLNPSLQSAFKGHHYAGPGHHFWKCIHTSGLVPHAMNACEDYRLPQFGVGFTNVVPRATKSASDLTKEEIQEGRAVLIQKIKLYKPKIVVLVGKGVFDIFYSATHFCYGKQSIKFPETDSYVFVIPSATGCGSSYWPRVQDKLPFFQALRKLRDHVKGVLPVLPEEEVIFPISSATNSSHTASSNGSITTSNGGKKPTNEGRGRSHMADRNATAVPNNRDSLELRSSPSAQKQNIGPVVQEIKNVLQQATGDMLSTVPSVVLQEEPANGQMLRPLGISQEVLWSASPMANSTIIGHSGDDSPLRASAAISAIVNDQLDDSSGYLSMSARYNGPVVFHHTTGETSCLSTDSEAIQQGLVLNSSPESCYEKRGTIDDSQGACDWPDIDNAWLTARGSYNYYASPSEYKEAADKHPSGVAAQGVEISCNGGDCQNRTYADKVWYEWCPTNVSGSQRSNLSITEDGELTRLFFLDDDFSDSPGHVIGQLVPASDL